MGDYDMTDAERDRMLEKIDAKVADIHEAIYGDTNGRRGLMTRVAILEEHAIPPREHALLVDQLAQTRKVLWFVGGLVVAEIVAMLFQILTHGFTFPGTP